MPKDQKAKGLKTKIPKAKRTNGKRAKGEKTKALKTKVPKAKRTNGERAKDEKETRPK